MKILIVDDSSTLVDRLVNLFSRELNAVECLTAFNGEEGFKVWSENRDINLIIADYNMPHATGLEMIDKIRRSETSQGREVKEEVTVFIVSSESSNALKVEAKKQRVKAWIIKPVSENALLNVIRKTLKIDNK